MIKPSSNRATRPSRNGVHKRAASLPLVDAAAAPAPNMSHAPDSVRNDERLRFLIGAWPALMTFKGLGRDLINTRHKLAIAETKLAVVTLQKHIEDAEAELFSGDPDHHLRLIHIELTGLLSTISHIMDVTVAVDQGLSEQPLA
jgi:hypothetical protein